jgi:ABC-type dipeptide/oligopeptide/nickel transport system permease component
MFEYLLKRIAYTVLVLLLLVTLVFVMGRLSKGNPIHRITGPRTKPEDRAAIIAKYGLDQPIWVQYARYMSLVLQGDLGRGIVNKEQITPAMISRMRVTLELGLAAFLLAYALAIPAGIISAAKQASVWDYGLVGLSVLGVAIPDFWLGLMLISLFSIKLQLLPISGYGTWQHLIMPALALGLPQMAWNARIVRSSMLEVLRQDYVRTARAMGLRETVVVVAHAFRNALLPLLSVAGLSLGYLIGGSVIIEAIFGRPGVGKYMIDAIYSRDYPVIQGSMLFLGGSVILANLFTDLLYAVADPRIKGSGDE